VRWFLDRQIGRKRSFENPVGERRDFLTPPKHLIVGIENERLCARERATSTRLSHQVYWQQSRLPTYPTVRRLLFHRAPRSPL
jgi:hypothetical protein